MGSGRRGKLLVTRASDCSCSVLELSPATSHQKRKQNIFTFVRFTSEGTQKASTLQRGRGRGVESTNTGRSQAHMLLWPRSSASRAERQMTRCPCAAAPSTLGGYARARTAWRSHARCAHTHFEGACKWEANLRISEKALRGK